MTRITRTKATLAAGLLAAVGLALPAAAQQHSTSTSISISDGEVEGYSVRTVDGTNYKIEFDEQGVHSAYIDGDEADFKAEGDVIYIKDGDTMIEFEKPRVGAGVRGGFGGIARIGDGDNGFFTMSNTPPTMVGLSQSGLDEQLRSHLDLDEGVGTMISSITEGLPAEEAGLEVGDVLIAVNGIEVTSASVLTSELKELEPGDELDVTVLRKGLPETMTIEVAKFDASKLYADRFFGARVPGAPDAPDAPRVLRWGDIEGDNFPFGRGGDIEFDFDFDDLRDDIRMQLNDVQELDAEQREALEDALGQAQEQIEQAMEQAARARGLADRARGNEFLIRDNDRPLVIERNTRRELPALLKEREQAERERVELEVEAERLRARNKQLESRLESLEARLDRLIELLEDRDDRDRE